MRVAPVGLLPDVPPETRAALAQFQAALTHGHPTALAASDLTAWTVADLAGGGDPATLPARLRRYALSQRTVYHADWLGTLWQRPYETSPQEFIARGWDECLGVLVRPGRRAGPGGSSADPCSITGEGWIAEEAFATGLLCFLLFPDDPSPPSAAPPSRPATRTLIACLTGAFAGACHGLGRGRRSGSGGSNTGSGWRGWGRRGTERPAYVFCCPLTRSLGILLGYGAFFRTRRIGHRRLPLPQPVEAARAQRAERLRLPPGQSTSPPRTPVSSPSPNVSRVSLCEQ